jgi:ribosomal protein L37E
MLPNCSDFDEDKHTKEYMAMHGIANVRGGTYCQVELAEETVRFLEKEIRGAQDACLRCGRTSHYVRDCFARTDAQGNPIIDAPPTLEWSDSSSDDSDLSSEDEEACYRCGRHGHWVQYCYARTDINGQRLYD